MSITKYLGGAALIECMEEIREVCSAANAVRAKNNIRTRQPLANMDIVSNGGRFSYLAFAPDLVQAIKDECNVKQLTVIDSEGNGAFVV